MKAKSTSPSLQRGLLLLAAATTPALCAQDKPAIAAPAPEPGTINRLFNAELPEAIGKSKISVNSRLRWEFADQDAVGAGPDPKESNAVTVRTRFGLTSGQFHGFQGMLEGENITVIGSEDNYNAAGSNGQPGRTIIADPPTTELNQAWLSYSNWDSVLKGGRQHLVLDNHRFIGDVGWRQNQQTFDAVSLQNKSVKDLTLTYAYLWEVNRVFGDVRGLPAANQDFDSNSHIINAAYTGWKYAKFVGYGYLLDLENAAGFINSTATYGAYFAGSAPVTDKVKLDYRGEFAWQTDYADSPANYEAEYYNIELGVNVKPVIVGAGYEVLGGDNGQGFKTPLATLHAFNGWADVFLGTPAAGLRDFYAFAQVTLPGAMPLRFVYHKYDADTGGADFGQEFDVVLSKKLGKHWTALAKYAHYDAEAAPYASVDKLWLQLEFVF